MARNVEKEKDIMLNGNRFLTNVDAHTGVFSRDVDKLFVQYKNLRMSVYNQHKGYLSDATTRDELWSYISEQFVRLVKEYDINGAIDFPGYILKKLTLRVKNSFIKGNYRDRKRVFVTKNEVDVTNLLERVEVSDTELDYYETLEYVLQGVSFDEMERDILYLLMQEHKETYIEQTLRAKYSKQGVTVTVIREKIADVQEFVKLKLESALEG